jgi:signal transduction histidine kinase
MQPFNETIERHTDIEGDRRRAQTVLQTLATLRSQGESLSEVAHDARNMVTALGLYCDLLEEPGVLSVPFVHYGQELRLVAAASRRLVEKLMAFEPQGLDPLLLDRSALGRLDVDRSELDLRGPAAAFTPAGDGSVTGPVTGSIAGPAAGIAEGIDPGRWQLASAAGAGFVPNPAAAPQHRQERARRWDILPGEPIANLASELMANRNLLAALAGTTIVLTVDASGGALPVRLTGEDLTRVLVNLVKNSCEAMSDGGRIHISLYEQPAARGGSANLWLAIEDNGPGIPTETLESVFTSGYTTRSRAGAGAAGWPYSHRGLGLAITRSIVESAGGRISALNREQGGARFEIELPGRKTGAAISSAGT